MTLLQRIARQPVAIAGLIVATYGLLVAFGVLELTDPQLGAVTTFGGAVIFLLRWLVTPAGEVVIQEKPDGTLLTGAGLRSAAAGTELDGFVAQVDTNTTIHSSRLEERGATDVQHATAVIVIGLMLVVALLLVPVPVDPPW